MTTLLTDNLLPRVGKELYLELYNAKRRTNMVTSSILTSDHLAVAAVGKEVEIERGEKNTKEKSNDEKIEKWKEQGI